MSRRLRRAAAVLFVVAAGLFTVGVASESDTHTEATKTREAAVEAAKHDEAAEAAGHDETDAATGEVPAEAGHDKEGTVLGVHTESSAAVTAAIAVSVALAVGLWFLRRRSLALVAIVFGFVLAVFDIAEIAEIAHQLDTARAGLAVLATAIAAMHLAAATTAGLSNHTPRPSVHTRNSVLRPQR